jgi:AraC family transcriptional regulator of adaptative response / DNA-3-methyladenine glycosylase II
LKNIVTNIRRILDLNLDPQAIDSDLQQSLNSIMPFRAGLRLPGIWTVFEAGVRAILGQQISVTAARNLVITLVNTLGEPVSDELALTSDTQRLFPTPEVIANNDLSFLKIPNSRKQTLRNLAQHYLVHDEPDNPQHWLKLKGIVPWTVDYARLRGLSNPDVFLGGDLGIKKAIEKAGGQSTANFNPKQAAPWRSYLTFQLWSL